MPTATGADRGVECDSVCEQCDRAKHDEAHNTNGLRGHSLCHVCCSVRSAIITVIRVELTDDKCSGKIVSDKYNVAVVC